MKAFERRHFLRLMGLSAGASPLVYGIGNSVLSKAFAATTQPLAIFFAHGETAPQAAPVGYVPPDVDLTIKEPLDATDVTWPALLAPLAPLRQKMVIVDNLATNMGKGSANHGYLYALFSAIGKYQEGNFRTPSGPTFDQYVANAIGKDTPVGSLLFGLQGSALSDSHSSTFAADRDKPLSHAGKPSILLERLVGVKGTAQVPGGLENAALMDTSLFHLMKEDVGRLEKGLASSERGVLADYLEALERYEKKQEGLRKVFSSENCQNFPPGSDTTVIERLESMFNLSTLALLCGVTRVIGISLANSIGVHDDFGVFKTSPWLNSPMPGGTPGGHGGAAHGIFTYNMYQTTMGLLAKLIRDLGPRANDLLATVMVTNGKSMNALGGHHGHGEQVPAFIYDGTGRLRTGARYYRLYGNNRPHIGDLYATLSHVVGAPVEKFGSGKGIMPELLA